MNMKGYIKSYNNLMKFLLIQNHESEKCHCFEREIFLGRFLEWNSKDNFA